MTWIQQPLRRIFQWVERVFDRVFGTAWNPFHCLGALGYFYFWVVAASGIYIYIFFDTGVIRAYDSVEYITNEQWYLAGVMRSLHRYASDALVAVMVIHMVREFAFDRFRGTRWYSWVTGIPMLWLVFATGITGYWMVWDRLAQYVATATTEWLDWLPLFGEPTSRNFLSPEHLNSRFFTLMAFLHIAVPLVLLFVMWFHLQRVNHAKVNPARGLAVGTAGMLLILSLVKPAISQGPADLGAIPADVGLDWFYLWVYPLIEKFSPGAVWIFLVGFSSFLMLLPWLPPKRRRAVARVDLANCNGCTRCAEDCPYGAIAMKPRSDGTPFSHEAVVDPSLCESCGICAGACPTSTPFRRGSSLVPGIDLPDFSLADLRSQIESEGARLIGSTRVMVIGCDHAADVARLRAPDVGIVKLRCIGQLPPSFIDFVISRRIADGVLLTGCRDGQCHHRLGVRWTEARIEGRRDPYLRTRVPRERLSTRWADAGEVRALSRAVDTFRERLKALQPVAPPVKANETRPADREVVS